MRELVERCSRRTKLPSRAARQLDGSGNDTRAGTARSSTVRNAARGVSRDAASAGTAGPAGATGGTPGPRSARGAPHPQGTATTPARSSPQRLRREGALTGEPPKMRGGRPATAWGRRGRAGGRWSASRRPCYEMWITRCKPRRRATGRAWGPSRATWSESGPSVPSIGAQDESAVRAGRSRNPRC